MTSTTSADEVAQQFDATDITEKAGEFRANYNVAPTQQILVVASHEGKRFVETMRWGLIPFFAKDKSIGARMINARAESISEKPAYRAAFKKRRCIIPADGFYEWQKIDSKNKQPWYFQPKDGKLLAFAGLWEIWSDPNLPGDAPRIISTTIITTSANEDMNGMHDRMPLILPIEEIDNWLDPASNDVGDLARFLQVQKKDRLNSHLVSNSVNSVKNNGPELIEVLP